jgi:hypothetical protein
MRTVLLVVTPSGGETLDATGLTQIARQVCARDATPTKIRIRVPSAEKSPDAAFISPRCHQIFVTGFAPNFAFSREKAWHSPKQLWLCLIQDLASAFTNQ